MRRPSLCSTSRTKSRRCLGLRDEGHEAFHVFGLDQRLADVLPLKLAELAPLSDPCPPNHGAARRVLEDESFPFEGPLSPLPLSESNGWKAVPQKEKLASSRTPLSASMIGGRGSLGGKNGLWLFPYLLIGSSVQKGHGRRARFPLLKPM